MLIPAILVSIVALLAAMDEQLFGASMMARPLFTGPIIGLIMGDLQTGVIIGATLESMFMGSIMVGSAVPPEVYASSILSIAIAIKTRSWSWNSCSTCVTTVCIPAAVEKLLLCDSWKLGRKTDRKST